MEKNKKILIGGIIALSLILAFVVFSKMGKDTTDTDTKISGETTLNENGKIDFFIETIKSQEFNKVSYLEKTAKVISGEDITLVSQANGKINKIYVKEGESVANGQKVAVLVDSIGNYGLNLERANLGVEGARIDYSSQKVNLDKAVDDAAINLERVQNDYDNTTKSLQKSLSLAKLSLDSSKDIDEDTTLSLQLQKLSNTLAKTELDVLNLKQNNIEQLKSFKNSTLSTYELLDNLMIDIIDFSDGILGITLVNKRLNDDFEDYLGLKNSQQLAGTKQLFKEFIKFKADRFDIVDISSDEILSSIQYEEVFVTADEGYEMAKKLLKEMSIMFDNSLVSVGSLDQSQINGFKTQVNGFETQTQQSFSSYLSFKSQVRTFLNTYKNSEKIADENLNLLEDEVSILEKTKNISSNDLSNTYQNNKLNYEKTELDTAKNIKNLEISLKNAKLVFNSAKQVRDVTLRKMSNAIKLSQNSSAGASKDYAKLRLNSSIFGVVTDILVDEGQDVNVGTLIATISNLKEIEAEVGLSQKELAFVKVGQKVVVNDSGKQIAGKVKSISPVADDNLMYKTTIEFAQKFKTIGGLVSIQIPVKTKQTLIPINIVEVTGEAKGTIKTLSGGILVNYPIELGKVWGDKIEVISQFKKDIDVITTNVSNYDDAKFELKIKDTKIEEVENKEK